MILRAPVRATRTYRQTIAGAPDGEREATWVITGERQMNDFLAHGRTAPARPTTI